MVKRYWVIALCFFLLTSTEVLGATRWVPFNFTNNTGGLNDGYSDTEIQDNQASDGQNFILSASGGIGTIQKRQGFTRINNTGATGIITGLQFYKQTNGNRHIVATTSANIFITIDYGSTSSNPNNSFTVIGSTSASTTQNDFSDFAVAEDRLIIEDGIGTTPPYVWSGSGSSTNLSGSPPNASMVAYSKTVLFLAGNTTNPSRLYFSNLGNIQSWTATDFLDVETNDGSIIRDIEPGLDALYIWKDKSIWRLSGTDRDNFILERMVDGIGTLSRKSVARLDNFFLFVTNQGDIALYDGGINVKTLSYRIRGSIANASFVRFQYSPGVIFNRDYYLSYSLVGSGTNNSVFLWNSLYDSWSKFSGLNANAFTVAEDSNGKEFLAFGDYNGFVNKYPSSTSDNEKGINFYWQSKWFNFPQLLSVGGGAEKTWKLLRIFADASGNYDLNVETRADFNASGIVTQFNLSSGQAKWDSAMYDTDLYAGANVVIGRIEPDMTKDFFQVKFSNGNASEPVTLRSYQMWLEPSERL